jgi:hypothetical protein
MSKLLVEDLKKDRMDKDNCSYGPKYWVSWMELLPSMKTESFLTPESKAAVKTMFKERRAKSCSMPIRNKQWPWSS